MGMTFKTTLGWLAWIALILLYLLSVAPIANLLARGLEIHPPIAIDTCKKADVMVILGGGRPSFSPELDGYQPTPLSLERIRYTALLYRECKLPILVSGGGDRPESKTMAKVLKHDYGINVTWVESQSMNTQQNALYSKKMLGDKQQTIVLITHAWHMPRSVWSFKSVGFKIIPAPTAFAGQEIPWQKLSYWIPRVGSLRVSALALHEYLGITWYWLTRW